MRLSIATGFFLELLGLGLGLGLRLGLGCLGLGKAGKYESMKIAFLPSSPSPSFYTFLSL
jgi:hypothetical protein